MQSWLGYQQAADVWLRLVEGHFVAEDAGGAQASGTAEGDPRSHIPLRAAVAT
jgi:hypothetical protein